MYLQTLEALNRACRQSRAVALITNLNNGEQALYYGDGQNDSGQVTAEQIALAQQALKQDRSSLFESDGQSFFIQPFNRPLRMLIIGAVHIAQDLIAMASQCGFSVTLVDPRQAFASKERFADITISNEWPDKALASLAPDARTAIITLSHDPKLDDPALEIALKSDAFYIGSLGSKKTHAARLQRLRENGFKEEQQARIRAPVGLDIGAKSTAEIAISIMAEVIQAYRQGN